MSTNHQARWITRQRLDQVKRGGQLEQGILLDTYNGYIVVEPAGSNIGDGAILSENEANFELQDVWYLGPKTRLREARRRLGLEPETADESLAIQEV